MGVLLWIFFTLVLGGIGSLFIDPYWASYILAGIVVTGACFGADFTDIFTDY